MVQNFMVQHFMVQHFMVLGYVQPRSNDGGKTSFVYRYIVLSAGNTSKKWKEEYR
jgi:DNA-nicking Smr family endonuclease